SLELGRLIQDGEGNVGYRFVSDYPFRGREPHVLDTFETSALAALRQDSSKPIIEVGGSVFNQTVRLASPVTMGQPCGNCHNTHRESRKKDGKVGDVRGIQSITESQPIEANLFAFKYLLIYFVFAALAGIGFILSQFRQSRAVARLNRELQVANDFLASISMK